MSTNYGRQKRAYSRAGIIVTSILVVGLIFGPLIYVLSLGSRQSNANARASTQLPPVTDPPLTVTFSTASNATTTEAETTTTEAPTTTTTETSTTTLLTTTTTTTTTTIPTTTTTTRTSTTTRTTTAAPTTTTSTATCRSCSTTAKAGVCASAYATCNTNTYNCPVLCYGTFLQNGAVPATCLNGAIPEWPAFRDCLCGPGACGSLCTANCAYTTTPATSQTTVPASVCENCVTTVSTGACSAQYAACTANPTAGCALLCLPYYQNNLPVYTGCSAVPEWVSLAACLCSNGCSTNTTCTANQC